MRKKNIIAFIILSIVAIGTTIGIFTMNNNEEIQKIEKHSNYNEQQCLYGCPSIKRKKKIKNTEATNFKRKYIKLK